MLGRRQFLVASGAAVGAAALGATSACSPAGGPVPGVFGLGVASGEPRYVLLNFLGTRDAAAGRGASNHSGYSNPALDRLVDAAGSEFDDAAREKLLVEATELGINDAISITICQMVAFWAAKKDITMTPRPDERTLAMGIHPRQ